MEDTRNDGKTIVRTLFKSMLGHDTGADQISEAKYSRFESKPGTAREARPVANETLTRMKVKANTRLTQRLLAENHELAPQRPPATSEQLSNAGIEQIPVSVLFKALPEKVRLTEAACSPK